MIDEKKFMIIACLVLIVYLPAFFLIIRHYHKRRETIPKKILIAFPVVFGLILSLITIILSGSLPWLVIVGILGSSVIYAFVMYGWSFIYYKALRSQGYKETRDTKDESISSEEINSSKERQPPAL